MERVQKIAQALYDKKAENIDILDIRDLSPVADYFIICTCNSTTQVKACTDEVEEKMAEAGFLPSHKEGYRGGSWVLIDYGDIVVHVMHREARDFYALEKIWDDAERVKIDLK